MTYSFTTTSPAANRSVKTTTQPYVYRTSSPTPSPSPGPSPTPPTGQTAVQKGSLPVIFGKGSKARVDGYILAAYGKLKKDEYTYINKQATFKNPYTGERVTYAGYFVKNVKKNKDSGGGGGGGGSNSPTVQKDLPPANPAEYSWNLPPHKWSLPVQPTDVLKDWKQDNGEAMPLKPASDHKYRRGRLWWKATPDIQVRKADGTLSKTSSSKLFRKYGFQFIWNPETFGTQVSVNMDVTPSANDRFIDVAGAFPATETVSFNIRLDRTNDFACGAAGLLRPKDIGRLGTKQAAQLRKTGAGYHYLDRASVAEYAKYYTAGGWNSKANDVTDKLVDLFERGTLADLEYLYRAINGPGVDAKTPWTNGRGVQTADIGFLMPTLLHIDIGPLSYDGYVTSLAVNHIAFTSDMVPIRTDVQISLNLLATAGLTTREATS